MVCESCAHKAQKKKKTEVEKCLSQDYPQKMSAYYSFMKCTIMWIIYDQRCFRFNYC